MDAHVCLGNRDLFLIGARLSAAIGPFHVSVKVALGVSQIGEFAFIVVKGGQDLGLVSSFLLPSIGVAGVTTFLTPYLMRFGYSRRW